MLHIHLLQLAGLIGFYVVFCHLGIHIHPEGHRAHGKSQKQDHLHIGQLVEEYPQADDERADTQPDHNDFRQHPVAGQAVAANVHKHLCAGGSHQEYGHQTDEQAQDPGENGGMLFLFHQGHRKADNTQVDAAEQGHFEEAPAGIFRHGEFLRQNPGEAAGNIGKLADQIQNVHSAEGAEDSVDGHGAEALEAALSQRLGAGCPVKGNAPGIEIKSNDNTEEQRVDDLRQLDFRQFGQHALEGGICRCQKADNHCENRQGQDQADHQRATLFAGGACGFSGIPKSSGCGGGAVTGQDQHGPVGVHYGADAAGSMTVLTGHQAQGKACGERHEIGHNYFDKRVG